MRAEMNIVAEEAQVGSIKAHGTYLEQRYKTPTVAELNILIAPNAFGVQKVTIRM
jgi:hypothetical protein